MKSKVYKIDDIKAQGKYNLVGGPFGSDLVSKDYVEAGVPVLRGTNLPFDKKFSHDDLVFVSNEKAKKLKANIAFPRDIVFTQRGTLGQIGIIPTGFYDEYVVSQSQMKLTVNEQLAVPEFVYYYFSSQKGRNSIKAHSITSGVPHINLTILKNLKILLPLIPVQQKIVSILSAYDDLIENNLKRIKLLEESINLNYNLLNSKEDKYWSIIKLNSLIDIISGYPFKSNYYNENGRYKIVTIKNVQDGFFISEATDKIDDIPINMSKKIFLNTGDIIMSLTGNVGRVCLVFGDHYVLNQRVIKLSVKLDTDKGFTYALLRDKKMQTTLENLSSGTAQQNLSPVKMGELFIKYPTAILRKEFNQITLPMIDLICKINQQNTKLREARDILLPRLMSGEIEV